MQKTKLGISVGLLGSAIFLCGLFGGYTPMLLLAGYVLLFEENEWLKKTGVKAVVLMTVIGVLVTAIGLVPDLFDLLTGSIEVFGIHFKFSFIDSLFDVINDAIIMIRTILFLILGIKALNQGTVKIPVVDGLINKYMG